MKRNRRMTFVLSMIGITFAVSWLPFHLYLILTDIFGLFEVSTSDVVVVIAIIRRKSSLGISAMLSLAVPKFHIPISPTTTFPLRLLPPPPPPREG